MLLKDAVLDLRKGRRYGVVFCPPTREGHQSHQSSWWVGCELCLKSTWLPPGNPPWKPSWILNPPQTQTGLHHNLRWVAMVRERPPWWVPSLLEVFQAWPPKWKPCTWSRRRRKDWVRWCGWFNDSLTHHVKSLPNDCLRWVQTTLDGGEWWIHNIWNDV